LSGSAGRDNDPEFSLERPNRQAFEKALIGLGIEQSDAERLAQTSGRSWSVIRRHHANNPAIRNPAWLASEHAWVVSTICLAGSWLSSKETDRAIIARIAGRPYQDIERALTGLAALDDSPVLKIGDVWKAKAPLELLDQYGARITAAEFEQFFSVARETLSSPDPILELPDDERYAAPVHGKVRPISTLLLRAIADGLAKLSVRGVLVPTLADAGIDQQVTRTIRDILRDAGEARWLSLDGLFRPLAEAAPETFIQALETSLRTPGAPVTRLIKETRSTSSFGGRCWHADLLWSLEILAWAPQRLARVCLILAQLSRVPTESTWNNSPLNTLVDIFRAWLPQTAATLEQRLQVLDTLIAKQPDAAFDLLDSLVYTGSDTASPSARPKWRDDDAGAGYAATQAEFAGMYLGAADRLLRLSAKDASRLAKLLEKIDRLDNDRRALILEAAKAAADFPDEEREIIRKALRHKLHWERNYRQDEQEAIEKHVVPLQQLYDLLSPTELTVRHAWLFENGWPEPPVRVRDDGPRGRLSTTDELRASAILEIYNNGGLQAVETLARRQPRAWFVGRSVPNLNLTTEQLALWIVERSTDLTNDDPLAASVSGLLHGLKIQDALELLDKTIAIGVTTGWTTNTQARLLALAPSNQQVWDYVAAKGDALENYYWEIVQPGFLGDDVPQTEYVARKLLAAHRPRTALNFTRFVNGLDPSLLAELLESLVAGDETAAHLPESWDVHEAVVLLEKSGVIEKSRLIKIEFALIPAMGFDNEHHAKTLYAELLSDPAFFVEFLKLIYRPAGQKDPAEPTEQQKGLAEIAFRVLHHCKRAPATREDGTVDQHAFSAFVASARQLAHEANRATVCDVQLGEILAHAPMGVDGVWPFEAARKLLDEADTHEMRRGLRTGLFNKRGMVRKAYAEGGTQERDLATSYRKQAAALHQSHPQLAAVLDGLANTYEREGRDDDVEARLREEGD
jgi:hypothetical protein